MGIYMLWWTQMESKLGVHKILKYYNLEFIYIKICYKLHFVDFSLKNKLS